MALKHNFVSDIAAQMPAAFSTDAPADTSKDARIRELEEALLKVTTERDVLERVMGGRPS